MICSRRRKNDKYVKLPTQLGEEYYTHQPLSSFISPYLYTISSQTWNSRIIIMKWSTLAVTTAWGMLLPFTLASSHAGGGHVYASHYIIFPLAAWAGANGIHTAPLASGREMTFPTPASVANTWLRQKVQATTIALQTTPVNKRVTRPARTTRSAPPLWHGPFLLLSQMALSATYFLGLLPRLKRKRILISHT